MTNASGMMRFSRGFMRFADKLPVVPVAARVQLPFGISTHTLTSSFLANMFWFCFSPYVSLHMTVLPPMTRSMVCFLLHPSTFQGAEAVPASAVSSVSSSCW